MNTVKLVIKPYTWSAKVLFKSTATPTACIAYCSTPFVSPPQRSDSSPTILTRQDQIGSIVGHLLGDLL